MYMVQKAEGLCVYLFLSAPVWTKVLYVVSYIIVKSNTDKNLEIILYAYFTLPTQSEKSEYIQSILFSQTSYFEIIRDSLALVRNNIEWFHGHFSPVSHNGNILKFNR